MQPSYVVAYTEFSHLHGTLFSPPIPSQHRKLHFIISLSNWAVPYPIILQSFIIIFDTRVYVSQIPPPFTLARNRPGSPASVTFPTLAPCFSPVLVLELCQPRLRRDCIVTSSPWVTSPDPQHHYRRHQQFVDCPRLDQLPYLILGLIVDGGEFFNPILSSSLQAHHMVSCKDHPPSLDLLPSGRLLT